jgi:hypothetical protein
MSPRSVSIPSTSPVSSHPAHFFPRQLEELGGFADGVGGAGDEEEAADAFVEGHEITVVLSTTAYARSSRRRS